MSLQPCSLFILNLIWPLSASSSSLPLFSKESGFVVDLKQKEVGSTLRAVFLLKFQFQCSPRRVRQYPNIFGECVECHRDICIELIIHLTFAGTLVDMIDYTLIRLSK